ncbi:Mdm33 family-domain-containing protein [Morchella snyderi]|nr:Mdm33 family-domain-containing protein [Morchella snyderi]
MRPLLRSILLARPTASPCNLRSIRPLHSNLCLFTKPACTRNSLLQPRRLQLKSQQARWVSSGDKNTPGDSSNSSATGGGAAGNEGGANDRPPPSPPTSSSLPKPHTPPISSLLSPVFKNLPSQQDLRRSEMAKKLTKAMEDLQIAVFTAGQKLNVLTGYSEIEALKKSIEALEEAVKSSRQAVRNAKEEYQSAIARRSASQREVNELLQRKHAWSPSDLERFTELYRSDHANEQAEVAAQEQLAVAESVVDDMQAKLSRSILSRYHEEQIWSDKIRRASTWVTWGLMGFNVLLFVVVQLWLEPWKRKRLVGSFEDKVRDVIQEEGLRNALLNLHVEPEEVVQQIMEMAGESGAGAVDTAMGADTAAVIDGEPVPLEEDIVHDAVASVSATGEGEAIVEEVAASLQDEQEKKPLWERDFATEAKKLWQYWNEKLHDLFSEQSIALKRVEFTTALLESAAFGAFVVISLRQIDFTGRILDSAAFGTFMAAIIGLFLNR